LFLSIYILGPDVNSVCQQVFCNASDQAVAKMLLLLFPANFVKLMTKKSKLDRRRALAYELVKKGYRLVSLTEDGRVVSLTIEHAKAASGNSTFLTRLL
jgi:hypothetical protein